MCGSYDDILVRYDSAAAWPTEVGAHFSLELCGRLCEVNYAVFLVSLREYETSRG